MHEFKELAKKIKSLAKEVRRKPCCEKVLKDFVKDFKKLQKKKGLAGKEVLLIWKEDFEKLLKERGIE